MDVRGDGFCWMHRVLSHGFSHLGVCLDAGPRIGLVLWSIGLNGDADRVGS